MVQEARDFYRFVLALGRHKNSLLHPEVSSDQGDGDCAAGRLAMASAKEGLVLSYHAAVRGAMAPRCSIRISAASVTTLNRPKSAGVVRAMARSDHWRWVSMPR